MNQRVRLSREVRFGVSDELREQAAEGANGFAGNPLLPGLFPYVTLTVTVSGMVDRELGMVVNIKTIDMIVRETALDMLRAHAEQEPQAIGRLAGTLFDRLRLHLAGKVEAVEQVELAVSPFLKIAAHQEELPMVRLTQRFEFSAAHRLHSDGLSEAENWETFGRCNNPNGHGHNYEVEVVVAGIPDATTGMVMPVELLQRAVNEHVLRVFDHKHLNLDCAEFSALNPTVENIARVIFHRLKPHIPGPAKLASLRVWETPKTMCEYSE